MDSKFIPGTCVLVWVISILVIVFDEFMFNNWWLLIALCIACMYCGVKSIKALMPGAKAYLRGE